MASAFPTFAKRGKGTDDAVQVAHRPTRWTSCSRWPPHRYLEHERPVRHAATTPPSIVEAVSAAGVDEVACLIDFGVDTDDVLDSLDLLLEAKTLVDAAARRRRRRRRAARRAIDRPTTPSPALVARHGVTHLQCTPSLAAMLVADPADRAALRHDRPPHGRRRGAADRARRRAARRCCPAGSRTCTGRPRPRSGRSTTRSPSVADGVDPDRPPIANTTVFVLDADGRRLPVGAFGELHIGGEGVARGYHDRPS